MLSDPSPAEVAAARAKEDEEQAALPYKWNQTIAELDVTFNVPGNFKSRDLVIEIKKQSLAAGIKGQDPIIKVHATRLPPCSSHALTPTQTMHTTTIMLNTWYHKLAQHC